MIDVIIIGAGTAGLSAAIQVSNIFLVLILRQIYITKQKT